MEDQSQKIEALKKAYAEIILNTAKEAAARVMASERKALRLQYDLRNTKEEALRMLVCLKRMIEVKKNEAELTSLSQQRRIEELDAQLNEAEEVIVDLRAELRNAHNQLEEVKNSHIRRSNEPLDEHMICFEHTAQEKKLDTSEEFRSSCDAVKEISTSGPLVKNLFDNPNLASVIIGSKGPELYRNGCTHRIRAIERNMLDGKRFPEDEPLGNCTKTELIFNKNERDSGKCAPSFVEAEDIDTKNVDLSEVFFTNSSVNKDQPVKGQRLPRSSVRYANSSPKLSRFRCCQAIKPEKTNLKENSVEKDEKKPAEKNEPNVCTVRRSIRKRKVRWDDITSLLKPRAALSRCKKYSGNDHKKFDEHSRSIADMNHVFGPTSATNAAAETNDEKSPEPLPSKAVEDTAVTNESGVNKNGLLKYTFSRKCKKDSQSKSDNGPSHAKSFMTRAMEQPSLIAPSSDSQNMVDVACQLISLSEEHRW